MVDLDIYTSTYQYVPVHTIIYYPYLNFAFFEIRHHPIISPAREMNVVAINSRRASWMYAKPSCLVSSTYQYVPVRTGHLCLYLSVPVCTCTYKYILVRTILPDPVQVYRIPDVTGSSGFLPNADIGVNAPISVYSDIDPDIGANFNDTRYRVHPISAYTRYRVVYPISGKTRYRENRYRIQYQNIPISGNPISGKT